ncbi:MAG: tRNA pseudouridine(38-40) synthase TruA [Clostridiales Family XIII bacterium]|nr:tRNA pseudouridine(38-40) synthase TruA [Clostridiales Family XIII bacterium]
MNNILLKIAYDGSGFHGWQKQPGIRTVQGVLEETLAAVCGAPLTLDGTSRTDAGVHAFGQCATLRGDFGIPVQRIPLAANNLLADIRILGAEKKPAGFHARFDALGKAYVYRFAVCPPAPPLPAPTAAPQPMPESAPQPSLAPVFLRNYACLLKEKPNIGNMAEAAKYIEGTQDFACFQAAGSAPRGTTVRTVFSVRISEGREKDLAGCAYETIALEVTGDGFLYNMVRIIAGTLADVGAGKTAPAQVGEIVASGNRDRAGRTAPPQGLYLKEVYF